MTYTITAPAGRTIHLWFIDFAIFSDPDNTYDEYNFEYEYNAPTTPTDCDNGDYIDVSDVDGGRKRRKSGKGKSGRQGNHKLEWGPDNLRMCGFYDPTYTYLWASPSATNQVTVKFHTTTDPKTADNKGFKIFLTDDNGDFTLTTNVTGLPTEM